MEGGVSCVDWTRLYGEREKGGGNKREKCFGKERWRRAREGGMDAENTAKTMIHGRM